VDLSLLVVTDRRLAPRPLLDVVKSALDGGARTFLLREKDLPRNERFRLAHAMRALGADVIVAGPDPLGCDAVHLAANDVFSSAMLTGRSCHGKAEVMTSTEDYVTLSPIFSTASKPGYGPALGTRILALDGGKPIIALGGIDHAAKAAACREAGAAGVAVMGAVMRAQDPAAFVRGLLS
jgi:thiamine-phosphate pyrophosphorylase